MLRLTVAGLGGILLAGGNTFGVLLIAFSFLLGNKKN